jgi:hypothetical protein
MSQVRSDSDPPESPKVMDSDDQFFDGKRDINIQCICEYIVLAEIPYRDKDNASKMIALEKVIVSISRRSRRISCIW